MIVLKFDSENMKWGMHLLLGTVGILSTTANDEFQRLGQNVVEKKISTEFYFGSSGCEQLVEATETHPVHFHEELLGATSSTPSNICTQSSSNIVEDHLGTNYHSEQDTKFQNKSKNKRKLETLVETIGADKTETELAAQLFQPLVKCSSKLTKQAQVALGTEDFPSRFVEAQSSFPNENSIDNPNLTIINPKIPKSNHQRLVFNSNILKVENLSEKEVSHINYASEIMGSLPKPKGGKFSLSKLAIQRACKQLRKQQEGLDRNKLPAKMKLIFEDIDVWFEHWTGNPNSDWKYSMDDLVFLGIPYILPVFLFYVEMIMTIIPHNKSLNPDEEIDYSEELENAIDFFKEFKKYLESESVSDHEDQLWEARKKAILVYVDHSQKKEQVTIVWHIIEAFMERYNPLFWRLVKEKPTKEFSRRLKSFFNIVFYYGSESLTQQLKGTITPK